MSAGDRILPDLNRVVEVLVEPHAGGRWRCGSGYEVTNGLVLTARHLLGDREEALVRFRDGRELHGELKWTASEKQSGSGEPERLDLALLRVAKPSDTTDAPLPHFGAPEQLAGEIPFCAVGFPLHMRTLRADRPPVRERKQIDGAISLGTYGKLGLLALETKAHPPPPAQPDGDRSPSPWEGMSGAAVFSGDCLVGVVTLHHKPAGGAMLAAVRISAVDDPKFVSADERADFWGLLGRKSDAVEMRSLGPRMYGDAGDAAAATAATKLRFKSLLGHHALFGGRERELEALSAFAQQEAGGYLFLTAPSGFGKTALLANWVQALEREGRPVAYSFISRLDGLADEDFTLRNLCQQLAALRDETQPLPASASELHALYVRFITTPLSDDDRLIVVLDGLDEADGWSPRPDLFPPQLADGVVVVFSAREVAERDWVAEVGLPAPSVEVVHLGTLGAAEVSRLLAAANNTLPSWATDETAVALIHERSRGDPFYLRYLVDDLVTERIGSLAQLRQQPSGLNAYLDRWWKELSEARAEAAQLTPAVQDLLGYLLVAKGPLARDDLTSMRDDDALDDWSIDDVVAILSRHLSGDTYSGLSLAHPRFRAYVASNKIKEPSQRGYRESLIAHCARWEDHESPYALRYYADHLAEGGKRDELMSLARDSGFEAAQRRRLPGEPRRPIRVVELAFGVAADEDDAPAMAELLLRKVSRLERASGAQSPLQALREAGVDAAWAVADLHNAGRGALWHLLVAWELRDRGQTVEALATLRRLAGRDLRNLPYASQFACAFAQLGNIDADVSAALERRLLDDAAQAALSKVQLEGGDTKQALETARTIADEEWRSDALREIALAHAQAGDVSGAREAFNAALEAAQAIEPDYVRDDALGSIAMAQARAGDYSAAPGSPARLIKDEPRMFSVLHAARASALARAGRFPEALESAQSIDQATQKTTALAAIASAQAEAGQLVAPLDTAEAIAEESRLEVLLEIALAQARTNDVAGVRRTFGAALDTARAIEDEADAAAAQGAVAAAQAKAGDAPAARESFGSAIETAGAMTDEAGRTYALAEIAAAQASAGDFAGARQTFAAALTTRAAVQDESRKARFMVEIASAQLETNDAIAASETLRAALEAALAIDDESEQQETLREVASTQTQAGDFAAALETARAMGHGSEQATVLFEIVSAQAHAGDFAGAFEAARSEKGTRRAHALREIASAQAQTGDFGGARQTLAEALETARAIRDTNAIAAIGSAQAHVGDFAGAWDSVRFEDGLLQSYVVGEIAAAQAEAGDFGRALETAHTIEHEIRKTPALGAVAYAQTKAREFTSARETARAMGHGLHQADVLRAIATAQARDGQYAAALDTARSIELEVQRTDALIAIGLAQAEASEDAAGRTTLHDALSTAREIEDKVQQNEAFGKIASALETASPTKTPFTTRQRAVKQAQAGDFTGAIETVREAPLESDQVDALGAIAAAMAQAGETAEAIGTMIRRPEALEKAAAALRAAGDTASLKRLLPSCAEYSELTPSIARCLARSYPGQTLPLARHIARLQEVVP